MLPSGSASAHLTSDVSHSALTTEAASTPRAFAGDPAFEYQEKRKESLRQTKHGGRPLMVRVRCLKRAAGVPKQNADMAESTEAATAEKRRICAMFQTCLNLRDKYMALSRQRLEDNPTSYDGQFSASALASGDASSSQTSLLPPVRLPPDFEKWTIYPPPPKPTWTERDPFSPESTEATQELAASETRRRKFAVGSIKIPGKEPNGHARKFAMDESGVYQVYDQGRYHIDFLLSNETPYACDGQSTDQFMSPAADEQHSRPLFHVPPIAEYFRDLETVLAVAADGPAKSFAWRRLKYLEGKFQSYVLLHEFEEQAEMRSTPHRDFYNVRKVDTHVHHSASMNQKHLLRFMKKKMRMEPQVCLFILRNFSCEISIDMRCMQEVVIHRDGTHLTLQGVFESLHLTPYDLSIDTLDMHAHGDAFRFDSFNKRYNPLGESRLREIFLKTDNLIQGRYLAEITKELFTDMQQSKYQMAEYRISIYGRSTSEWDKLAKWIVTNELFSDNVRWLIQIPRLYDVFKKSGGVENFEEVVRNIFQPLYEVTADPSSHPELHIFLQRVVGFDSVDDESKAERRLYRKFPLPRDWNTTQNPPYNYWLYYLFANITSLNNWRHERGFNTFWLRPHAGEAGDPDHLTSAFLTSHSISHGILLRKVPVLQYLFYLKQIGIAMSPLSNNALFLTYERNPLPNFFRTGLNVSLSTDDPLQFHFTKASPHFHLPDAELSRRNRSWKSTASLLRSTSSRPPVGLSAITSASVCNVSFMLRLPDMCELARNSCVQSGFEMEIKRHWLGPDWYKPGVEGNLMHKTNVPNLRAEHRWATLMEERDMIGMVRSSSDCTAENIVTAETSPASGAAESAGAAAMAGGLTTLTLPGLENGGSSGMSSM
ncbi:SPOSA6832_04255, partial [Sporobolomyces salmonicolor]